MVSQFSTAVTRRSVFVDCLNPTAFERVTRFAESIRLAVTASVAAVIVPAFCVNGGCFVPCGIVAHFRSAVASPCNQHGTGPIDLKSDITNRVRELSRIDVVVGFIVTVVFNIQLSNIHNIANHELLSITVETAVVASFAIV